MNSSSRYSIAVGVILAGLVCVLGLAGCKSPEEYKLDSDERVYNMIDEKWEPGFGEKVNYRISDVEPAGGSLVLAQRVPSSSVLGLAEAVGLATAHNREYQLEKENLYTQALNLRLIQHDFEKQFFGVGSSTYERESRRGGSDEAVVTEGSFGFDQLLASGAQISTAVTTAWLEILMGNARGGLSRILSATITQPLMRGSGRDIVQEPLTQAERDTLYQIRAFNRFRQTFVVSIITDYYRVLELLDAVRNAEANYETLRELHGRAEKLTASGRLPEFELDQASQDLLQAENILIEAKKEHREFLDAFKIRLAVSPSVEFDLDETELESLVEAGFEKPQFGDTDAISTSMRLRLDLANAGDVIYDAERKVHVAADALRAGLNVAGTLDVASEPSTDVGTLGTVRGSGAAGLELDLPLDRVEEQTIYRQALITLTQSERNYEQTLDTVALEVRQSLRDLNEAAERYRVQRQSFELAQQRYKNTELLLQYGRANTRDVLDSQEDLFDAQNAATSALVDFNIAVLNFYRDTGVLQVLPDGMWQAK